MVPPFFFAGPAVSAWRESLARSGYRPEARRNSGDDV